MKVEELNLSDYIDDIRRELRHGTLIGKKGDQLISCHNLSCRECDLFRKGCHVHFLNFLFTKKGERVSPYWLTDEERHLLLCLNTRYKWMARDKHGTLLCFENKPIEIDGEWKFDGSAMEIVTYVFQNTSFDFVKAGDSAPWPIENMLKMPFGSVDTSDE